MARTVADLGLLFDRRADPTTDLYGIADWPAETNFQAPEPTRLNRLIEERGLLVEWRRGVPCPCARPDTRAPREGCPHCKGLGRYYPADQRARSTVLMTSRRPDGKPWAVGDLVTGAVSFTFPEPGDGSGTIPRDGDLIFPIREDGSAFERHDVAQLMVRAQNQVERANLDDWVTIGNPAIPKQTPQPEMLRYQSGIELEWLGWEIREGAVTRIAEGREGVDFDLVGNEIRWKDGRGPEAGYSYSVRYTAPAAYMVLSSTFRGIGSTVLPRSAMGIRLDQWDPNKDYR